MTKRFCDICGTELENSPYAANPYLTYPIVSEDICDNCKTAFKDWSESQRVKAHPFTMSPSEFVTKFYEKCKQCGSCSRCRLRYHVSSVAAGSCIKWYAQALESGKMTPEDSFGATNEEALKGGNK